MIRVRVTAGVIASTCSLPSHRSPAKASAIYVWCGAALISTAAHPQLGCRAVDAPTEGTRGADVGALLPNMVAANNEQRRWFLLGVLAHELHHFRDGNVLQDHRRSTPCDHPMTVCDLQNTASQPWPSYDRHMPCGKVSQSSYLSRSLDTRALQHRIARRNKSNESILQPARQLYHALQQERSPVLDKSR